MSRNSDFVLIVVSIWGRLTLGNPLGSGFWHSTNGVLDGNASRGAAGQLAYGGALDILWGAPAGDVQLSTSPAGVFTVVGLLGAPIPALSTSGVLVNAGGSLSWSGGGPETQVYLNAPISAGSLAPGTTYLVDSTTAFTQTLPVLTDTLADDGKWFDWEDHAGVWNSSGSGTKNFSVNGNGKGVMDPAYIGNTSGPAGYPSGIVGAGQSWTVTFNQFRAKYRTTWVAAIAGRGLAAGYWRVS